MKLVSIGYGRTLFDADNPERARLAACAEALGEVQHVVFSRRSDALSYARQGALNLYPTYSRTGIGMLFDAYRIGAQLLSAGKGDVVTAQDPLASGLVAWLLAKRYKRPLVLQEHGDIFSGSYWRRESMMNGIWYLVAAFLIRRADRVRGVSLRVKRHLIAQGVDESRITILPVFSPVASLKEAAHSRNSLRERFPEASLIVLSVARFVPQKNLSLLLHAFAALVWKDANARLILVGRGPLEARLKQESATYGLADRVVFMPWSDDVASLMRSADIYALSSNYEGWARVLPEAMACGLPIVTTDVGCAGEVLVPEQHGLVVPVGDADAFTGALLRLAQDTALRTSMRAAELRDTETQISDLSEYARAWARVYSEAVNR